MDESLTISADEAKGIFRTEIWNPHPFHMTRLLLAVRWPIGALKKEIKRSRFTYPYSLFTRP